MQLNQLIDIDTGKKLAFPMNSAFIWGTVMATLVNAIFWNEVPNIIMDGHQVQWFGHYWISWKFSAAKNCE